LGWQRYDASGGEVVGVAGHGFAGEERSHEPYAIFEARAAVIEADSHRPELALLAARPDLDDERPRGHRRQRADLFCHEDGVPQRQEEEATCLTLPPFGQDAAEHRHVLDVSDRSCRVVVSERQRVEPCSGGRPRLLEDEARTVALGLGSVADDVAPDRYPDAHHGCRCSRSRH
jgi:hypothetical protein